MREHDEIIEFEYKLKTVVTSVLILSLNLNLKTVVTSVLIF
jgi:hypothetical protein